MFYVKQQQQRINEKGFKRFFVNFLCLYILIARRLGEVIKRDLAQQRVFCDTILLQSKFILNLTLVNIVYFVT